MKTFKNTLGAANRALFSWPALILMAVCALGVSAFSLNDYETARATGLAVTRSVLTDKTIAFRLKWVGSGSEASVQVASGGDMTFEIDGTGDDADETVSTDGVIDLSTPAAGENTFGEVCDIIDATANWECELGDVLPSWSTDNILSTLAETAESTGISATYDLDGSGLFSEAGLAVTINSADLDKVGAAISPTYTDADLLRISDLNNRCNGVDSGASWVSELNKATVQATYSSGAPTIKVVLVKKTSTGLYAGATEQTLWTDTITTSATDQSIDFTDLPPISTKATPGAYLVVTIEDASTPDITANRINIHGLTYQVAQ